MRRAARQKVATAPVHAARGAADETNNPAQHGRGDLEAPSDSISTTTTSSSSGRSGSSSRRPRRTRPGERRQDRRERKGGWETERGREGRGGVTRSWLLTPPTPAPIFALHLAQHLHQNLANNKTVGAGRWRARGVGRRATGDGRRKAPSLPFLPLGPTCRPCRGKTACHTPCRQSPSCCRSEFPEIALHANHAPPTAPRRAGIPALRSDGDFPISSGNIRGRHRDT